MYSVSVGKIHIMDNELDYYFFGEPQREYIVSGRCVWKVMYTDRDGFTFTKKYQHPRSLLAGHIWMTASEAEEYIEKNKELINQKRREYYEKNKEHIAIKKRERKGQKKLEQGETKCITQSGD